MQPPRKPRASVSLGFRTVSGAKKGTDLYTAGKVRGNPNACKVVVVYSGIEGAIRRYPPPNRIAAQPSGAITADLSLAALVSL